MLELKNITVSYRKNVVLEHLDLVLDATKIHGIVGLNGAGKTTLLRAVYGLKDIDEGRVIMPGKSTLKPIAFLETINYFYPKITGFEYLKLINKGKESNVNLYNSLFALPLHKIVDHYSTGMRKKLAFLGILSLQRPILFLDEPFNGIDLDSYQTMKQVILQLRNKGQLIVITSHILESLTSICDEIHILNNKCISRTYQKEEFNQIESDLFKNKDFDISEVLNKL